MSDEDDCGAWVQFSEVGINMRMRNALELFEARQRAAPAAGRGLCTAGALASEDAKTHDGEEKVTAAGSAGSAVTGQQPLSATREGSSADLKRMKRA